MTDSQSSNPQADHGGACHSVLLSTNPGIEYYHIHSAFTSRGLVKYRGPYKVGDLEVEYQPLWRTLRDEGRAPPGVVEGGSEGGGVGRGGDRYVGREGDREGDRDRCGGDDGDGNNGDVALAEGGGSGAGDLPGGAYGGGCHIKGSCTDTQWGERNTAA